MDAGGRGRGFELTPTLEPLAPFHDRLTVVTGLANKPALPATGEGTGDHVRAAATFLTGVHPKKTEGPDIRAGVSMDQIAARELGQGHAARVARALPRLERADRRLRRRLQLRLRQHAVVAQPDDAAADGEQAARGVRAAVRRQRQHDAGRRGSRASSEDRSILDSLLAEVSRLQQATSAPAIAASSTQYLDAIRDIERRIQKAEEQSDIELPRRRAADRRHPGDVRRSTRA